MNSTTFDDPPKFSRRTAMWTGTGLVAALVLGSAALGRIEPMTTTLALGIAALGAAGTFVMAWLMQRHSRYPRWAWWTTAMVMAGAILISLAVAGDPAVWEENYRTNTWMLPWFLLILGGTRASGRGGCAPSQPRSGWSMVGSGLLFSLIVVFAHQIANWLTGGS